MGEATVILGDVLEILKGHPDNSYDAIYCDPPYGLTDKSSNAVEDRLFDILSNFLFPDLSKLDPEFLKEFDLSSIPLDGSFLSREKVAHIVNSGVCMPKGAIDFQGDIKVCQEKIDTGLESASGGISDSMLSDEPNPQPIEFLGDFVLDFRDTREFSRSYGLGGNFTQEISGGFAVPISSVFNSSNPSLLSRLLSASNDLISDGSKSVRGEDDTLSQAATSAFIVALTRAVNPLMLRFNLGGGSLELSTASGAGPSSTLCPIATPNLIGTLPRTCSLPSMFKPVRVSLIDGSTNQTLPFYFHIWLHENWIQSLHKARPNKGFMGKKWDHGVPSAEVWKEILRVLKPGGYLLAFGGTRMWHRLAVNIEDGGFEIKDGLMWIHSQGFPKGLDLSKAMDKAEGANREVIGVASDFARDGVSRKRDGSHTNPHAEQGGHGYKGRWEQPVTVPSTSDAKTWEGYRTALKPAWEPIVVAMKPLEGTYIENALKYGVAGFNIDGSRIGATQEEKSEKSGRYPTNLILQHTIFCVCEGTKKVKASGGKVAGGSGYSAGGYEHGQKDVRPSFDGFASEDGTETINNWICSEDCPVRILDEQTGVLTSGSNNVKRASGSNHNGNSGSALGGESRPSGTEIPSYGDRGGASRFFYNAKASKSEREAGLEITFDEAGKKKRSNTHPTIKPIDLNRYFTHLILPPQRDEPSRKLLVPFSGVGSEMIGALLGGWDQVVGIEIDPEYVRIARERIEYWKNQGSK